MISAISFSVEARYPQQIWDLEVPLERTDITVVELALVWIPVA